MTASLSNESIISTLKRAAGGALLAAFVYVANLALAPYLGGRSGFPFLLFAVAASSMQGGLAAGLAALVTGFLLLSSLLQDNVSHWLVALLEGGLLIFICVRLRSRARKLTSSLASLERHSSTLSGVAHANVEALRETEQRLRLALEASGLATWDHDLSRDEIQWSDSLKEMLGYPKDKTPKFSQFLSQVESDDREWVLGTVERVKIDPSANGFVKELRVRRLDSGEIRWVAVTVRAVRQRGAPLRLIGTVQDITTRKQRDEDYKHRNEIIQAITDHAGSCLFMVDERGYATYMNPAAERVTGFTLAEVQDKPLHDYIHHKTRNGDPYPLAHCPLTKTLESGICVRDKEDCMFRKNGQPFPVSISFIPLRGEGIKIHGAVVEFRDITAQKDAEIALRKSEANFRALAEAIPNIVWVAKPNGTPEYANRLWYEYTGLTDEETESGGWITACHPEDRDRESRGWNVAGTKGEAFSSELRIRSAQGEYRWHLARGVPQKDSDGTVLRWFCTGTDVHDLKALQESLALAKEAAETSNMAKSAFLANMSHEIRSPLHAIVGFGELLSTQPSLPPEKKREFIHAIRRNGELLTRLIDDILDISKVEAGKLQIEKITCHLPSIVNDVAALLRQQAQNKGISLHFRTEGEVPEIITSDPTRLKQILINLIGNAIKFTASGGVDVTIKLEDSDLPGARPQLVFLVKDTGPGIAEHHVKNLFTPFSQADSATTRRFGGTGLGLALSRRLARALGGDVTLLESVVGRGSTFQASIDPGHSRGFFLLESPFAQSADENPPGSSPLKGLDILVAEDSADNQLLIEHLLTKNGAKVDIAENGKIAVEKATHGAYDLVLMDLFMPVCDGYQATMTLRRKGFKKPILALSAAAMKDEQLRSRAVGCDDHISKPVNVRLLIEKITAFTAKSRSEFISRA